MALLSTVFYVLYCSVIARHRIVMYIKYIEWYTRLRCLVANRIALQCMVMSHCIVLCVLYCIISHCTVLDQTVLGHTVIPIVILTTVHSDVMCTCCVLDSQRITELC